MILAAGYVVNSLTLLSPAPSNDGLRWFVRCICGKTTTCAARRLRARLSKSCGCKRAKIKHGLSKTPEHNIWLGLWKRTTNPKCASFKNYGARGIKVCSRWRNFSVFLADMGPRPSPAHTVERKNNERGYTPKNCCWATRKEQNQNTRQVIWLSIDGKKRKLLEWSALSGVAPARIRERLLRGWKIKRAVFTPSNARAIKNAANKLHIPASAHGSRTDVAQGTKVTA